jgi:hypothetical protein
MKMIKNKIQTDTVLNYYHAKALLTFLSKFDLVHIFGNVFFLRKKMFHNSNFILFNLPNSFQLGNMSKISVPLTYPF